jgi:hypothetical protein
MKNMLIRGPNAQLEKDFSKHYTDNFNMGGLAGFPFGGVTSFGGTFL